MRRQLVRLVSLNNVNAASSSLIYVTMVLQDFTVKNGVLPQYPFNSVIYVGCSHSTLWVSVGAA